MMSVRVSVAPVAQTVVSQTVSQTVGSVVVGISISIGGGLSISGPLAVVTVTRVSVSVSPVAPIGIRVGIITIGQPWVSLSLRLGLWLTGDEGGKANHKSELHCYL